MRILEEYIKEIVLENMPSLVPRTKFSTATNPGWASGVSSVAKEYDEEDEESAGEDDIEIELKHLYSEV